MTTPATSPTARDPRLHPSDVVLGLALVVGGLAAAWVAFAVRLLPGGFMAVDAPSWQDGLRAGVDSGAASAVLVVAAVGSVGLGAHVLRHGRTGLATSSVVLAYAPVAAAAAVHGRWLLTAAAALAGLVVVAAARHREPPRT